MQPAGLPLWLLLLASVTLLLAGLALLKRGWYPRRRGDTPHCRACGYNLTALTSDRCPECGAAITPTTTIHGERHRRPIVGVAGIICILLIPLLWIGPARSYDWYMLKPTFWVVRDAQSTNAGTYTRAWNELSRRTRAGSLSITRQSSLIDCCLQVQGADPPDPPSIDEIFAYLRLCDEKGLLSRAQKQRYIDQAVRLKLEIRSPVLKGDEVLCRVWLAPRFRFRGLTAGSDLNYLGLLVGASDLCTDHAEVLDEIVAYLFSPEDQAQLDGRSVEIDFKPYREPDPFRGNVSSRIYSMGVYGFSCPRTGEHNLRIPFDISLRGPYSVGRNDPQPALDRRRHWLEGRFEVVEAFDKAELIPDLALQNELEACIVPSVSSARLGAGAADLALSISAPPVNIAFDVYVSIGTQEYEAGSVYLKHGNSDIWSTTVLYAFDGTPPTTADVILRGSTAALRRTVDIYTAWEGELVYRNVPILAAQPATAPSSGSWSE